ncbi:anaerobic ribonucleoside-triphosphate reductase activating protein [Elusimicrobiota bacterium]
MKISGIKKSSLIDWPPKVVTTLFVSGCNFNCGWCHNADLVLDSISSEISWDYLEWHFEKGEGWLDGICLTGGEPLMQEGLVDLLINLRKYNLPVKLDTNGSYPEELKRIIKDRLVEYVAMDIKCPMDMKYSEATGVLVNMDLIRESVRILMDSGIDYEFRTTVVPSLLSGEDIVRIGKEINGAKKYVLQNFENSSTLDEKFRFIKPYSEHEIEKMADSVSGYAEKIEIR